MILTNEIASRLKETTSTLTPFLLVLLLKAASTNKINLKIQDFYIIEVVIRKFEANPAEYDLNQKAMLFKFIAKLDLNFANEKALFPSALLILSEELQEKMLDLAENHILNIISAFNSLPSQFNYDLLNSVHEMIASTLEKNNDNINSLFLLKYVEIFNLIRKNKKWDLSRLDIFTIELAKRLGNDSFLEKPQNLKKIIDIYFNIESDIILKKMKEIIPRFMQQQENCFMLLEYLAQHNEDISEFLTEVLI
jgi:hypothetical protein